MYGVELENFELNGEMFYDTLERLSKQVVELSQGDNAYGVLSEVVDRFTTELDDLQLFRLAMKVESFVQEEDKEDVYRKKDPLFQRVMKVAFWGTYELIYRRQEIRGLFN